MTAPARDDGFAFDFALLNAPEDAAAARALADALARLGARPAWRPGQEPAGGHLDDQLARSRWVLVLWSAASRGDAVMRTRALEVLQRHALLPVRLDLGEAPDGLAGLPEASLAGWQGDAAEPVFSTLVRSIGMLLGVLSPMDPAAQAQTAPQPAPGLWQGLRQAWQRWTAGAPAQRPALPAAVMRGPAAPADEVFERTMPLERPVPAPRPQPQALPLWVGVSAPRHAAAGQEFQARLGLFIEPMRAAVQAALAGLEPGVSPVPAAGSATWLEGAPLSIVVHGGDDLQVNPPQRALSWGGASELSCFSVTVAPGTPFGPQTLQFLVLLAGVPLASLSLDLRIERSNMATALAVPVVEPPQRLPRSLWLALAGADADEVARRCAALLRWAPGMRLVGPEPGLTELAREQALPSCEAVLLCWSVAAASEPAVARALRLAWQRLGPEKVMPMPLADPAEAWPPAEYAAPPWRERYEAAWLALAPAPQIEMPSPTLGA